MSLDCLHYKQEGAYGIMVIIVGYEHSNPSSNSGWGCLLFT